MSTEQQSAEKGLPTCPSECAETNHPGMEHEQWLPPEKEAAAMRLIEFVRPYWDDEVRDIPSATTETTPTPAAPSRRAEVNGEGE